MLDALVLGSRLLLAAVFVVAGATKLADREGSKQAAVAFGAPKAFAPGLALLLPIAELAVAVLLLPTATALAGALGALALLLLFSTAIAVNLARGRAPDCHCFGQLHSAPVGPWTLARNGALAAVAAVAVAGIATGTDTSAVAWIGRLDGSESAILAGGIAAAALLVAGAMAFMSLLRAHGRVLVRLDQMERTLAAAGLQVEEPAQLPEFGLEPGTPAPGFAVSDSSGAETTLDDLLAPGVPLLMVFASSRCAPCRELLPEVAEWQADHADRLTVAVASDDAPEDVRAEAEELGLEHVLIDDGGELYRAFEANGTPSAVLIAADGSIASHVASGPARIRALADGVLEAPGVPIGAPVPALELPALDGESVKLADLQGRDTLLLFWNPDCGHCRAMHDELLAWEASANGGTPRLVVVSSADEDRIRSDGFRSTVLLDDGFVAGHEFGVNGTPMAVLLGADGRVASDVAAGAGAVFALTEQRGNAELLSLPS